jgi:sigma-54 dependent transcriptional regulator, flagellar regulatory protein
MPPLRERLDDLPILIEHLVRRQGENAGRHIRLDKGAMSCLARNRWPGNVRELANLLERLAILYPEQTVGAQDLPERYRAGGAGAWFDGGVRIAPAAADPPPVQATRAPDPVRTAGVSAAEDLDGEHAVAERRMLDAPSNIDYPDDLEPVVHALKSGGIDLKDHLSAIEIGLIRRALAEADGTVAEAARLLRIRRTTLVEKLRKYRLTA